MQICQTNSPPAPRPILQRTSQWAFRASSFACLVCFDRSFFFAQTLHELQTSGGLVNQGLQLDDLGQYEGQIVLDQLQVLLRHSSVGAAFSESWPEASVV